MSDGLRFQRSTPVLKSGHYERARAYYVDKLGYRVVEEGGDPPRFGIFERGAGVLFVDSWKGSPRLASTCWSSSTSSGTTVSVVV